MNTRSEIEEYLKSMGVEIQSKLEDRESTEYGSEVVQTGRILSVTGEKVFEDNVNRYQIRILNDNAKKALLDLINQSITNGDMETANIALEVLQEESSFYKGHRNAALSNKLPLDKRIEFDQYCEAKNEKRQFAEPMAAFKASAQNIANNRRTETINRTTAEIKDATIQRGNIDREH